MQFSQITVALFYGKCSWHLIQSNFINQEFYICSELLCLLIIVLPLSQNQPCSGLQTIKSLNWDYHNKLKQISRQKCFKIVVLCLFLLYPSNFSAVDRVLTYLIYLFNFLTVPLKSFYLQASVYISQFNARFLRAFLTFNYIWLFLMSGVSVLLKKLPGRTNI